MNLKELPLINVDNNYQLVNFIQRNLNSNMFAKNQIMDRVLKTKQT